MCIFGGRWVGLRALWTGVLGFVLLVSGSGKVWLRCVVVVC